MIFLKYWHRVKEAGVIFSKNVGNRVVAPGPLSPMLPGARAQQLGGQSPRDCEARLVCNVLKEFPCKADLGYQGNYPIPMFICARAQWHIHVWVCGPACELVPETRKVGSGNWVRVEMIERSFSCNTFIKYTGQGIILHLILFNVNNLKLQDYCNLFSSFLLQMIKSREI